MLESVRTQTPGTEYSTRLPYSTRVIGVSWHGKGPTRCDMGHGAAARAALRIY